MESKVDTYMYSYQKIKNLLSAVSWTLKQCVLMCRVKTTMLIKKKIQDTAH